jgi:hypothetical protein
MKKVLLMVFTGDGKGKTTAALGLALRSAGHGLKICFIQFIKGAWKYGELEAVKRLEGFIDFHVMGKGFTWQSAALEQDKAEAHTAWALLTRWARVMACSRSNMASEASFQMRRVGQMSARWQTPAWSLHSTRLVLSSRSATISPRVISSGGLVKMCPPLDPRTLSK